MNLTSLIARRLQKSGHGERGINLVNVIISIVVLGLLSWAFISSTANNTRTASNVEKSDAAGLYAQSVVEQARALPWSDLGFDETVLAVRPKDDKGRQTVLRSATTTFDKKKLVQHIRNGISLEGIKGAAFTSRTDITWEKAPPRAAVNPTEDNYTSGFGVKRVTTTVCWGGPCDPANGFTDPTDQIVTREGLRTPSVGEAVPSDIQVGGWDPDTGEWDGTGGGIDVGDTIKNPTLVADIPSMTLSGTVDRAYNWRYERARLLPGQALPPLGGSPADSLKPPQDSTRWTSWNNNPSAATAPRTCGPYEQGRLYTSGKSGSPSPADALNCAYGLIDEGGWFRIVADTTLGTRYSNVVYLNAQNNFKAPVLTLASSTWSQNNFTWTGPLDGVAANKGYFPPTEGIFQVRTSRTQNGTYTDLTGTGLDGTARSWNHANPPSGTNWYQVCAILGTNAQCSNKISEYTIYPVTKPVVTLTYASATARATATWPAVVDAASYTFRQRVLTNGSWSAWTETVLGASGTTRAVAMTNGTSLQVQVRATNARGTGEWSDVKEVESQLLAPTITYSNSDNFNAAFAWTASVGATSYKYQYRVNSGAWSGDLNAGTARTAYRGGNQGDLISMRVAAVNSAGASPWSNIATGYVNIAATGASSWGTNDGKPYYRTSLRGMTCPSGTISQTRFRDRGYPSGGWNGWSGWGNGGQSESQYYTSMIDSYDEGLGVQMQVRCANTTTGQVSDYTTHGEYARYHPVDTPWGLWAGAGGPFGYRTAQWGAACSPGLTPVFDWWITGNINGGAQWVTYTSYSNQGTPWGNGVVSITAHCQSPAGRTGGSAGYQSAPFG